MTIAVEILGASFFATHHASPADALAGVGRAFTPPAFALLVGRARRFTSLVTQLHMEVCGGLPAHASAGDLPAVFATCHGEIQTALRLISDFRDIGEVSSAQFAHSVHNTPSGLWAIATRTAAPTTTLTGENAIAAGWLEAALLARETGGLVVLSIADEPVPPAFRGPGEAGGVAAAFLVGPAAHVGRPAVLLIDESGGDAERPSGILARAVHACSRRDAGDLVLGAVAPGRSLRLLVSAAS